MAYDIVVIGSGVAGYPAAVIAARHGLRVAVVEEGLLGGECINYGCVPSKTLIHYARVAREARRLGLLPETPRGSADAALREARRVAVETREGLRTLLEAAGVELVEGRGAVEGCGDMCRVRVERGGETLHLEAARVLVATGSTPLWPGWVERCDRVLDNRGLFERGLPSGTESVAVVGGGVAGVEIADALALLGLRVTLYEAMDRVLPGLPRTASTIASRLLRSHGVLVETGRRVERVRCRGGRVEICVENRGCDVHDAAIVALGRRPRRDALPGLGDRLERDEKMRLRDNPRIYVAGDAAGPPFLAHRAIAESLTIAADLLGVRDWRMPRVVPTVVYTTPEIIVVEAPGAECRRRLRHYWGYATPVRIEGVQASLAYAEVCLDGDDRVAAVTLSGPGASNVAAEATLLVEKRFRVVDAAAVIHPHPTSGEALMETLLEALGLGFNRAR